MALGTKTSVKMHVTLPARWCFNVSNWQPTKKDWTSAIFSIQPEERSRVEKFVFQEDAKSALVGRLLLRKLVAGVYKTTNAAFTLGRSPHGRPLIEILPKNTEVVGLLDFNISHHGSYCVLAAHSDCPVGIDVMERTYQGGNSLPEFFRLMQRKFTAKEWDFICGPVTEKEQEKRFFRLWSLKESYVKADGRGLGIDLQRLSFTCNSPNLFVGESVTDTVLAVDGLVAHDWTFEETLLDQDHGAAVALNSPAVDKAIPSFTNVTLSDLTSQVDAFLLADQDQAWTDFQGKPSKQRI